MINQDLLNHIEAMKKSTIAMAAAIPQMIEDGYKKLSPEDAKKYAEALKSSDVDKRVKDIAESIKNLKKK